MRVLLTRPRVQSEPLAQTLRGRGYGVRIEPMLDVVPLEGEAPDLDGVAAILFTSSNGVRAFARRSSRRDRSVFAVGETTAAAAREAGFANVESAAGDTRSLAAVVVARLDPADGALLHVSGQAVAGDLAGDLEGRGFALRRAVLYRTEPAREFSSGLKKSLARGQIDVVLFFSPRTAAAFVEGVARAGLSKALGGLTALCLSEAVAARLRGFGWRRIEVTERPDAETMLDRLDRLRGAAAGGKTEEGMTETTLEEAGTAPEPSAAKEGKVSGAPQGSEEAPARPRGRGRILLRSLVFILIAGGVVLFGSEAGRNWLGGLSGPKPTAPAIDTAEVPERQEVRIERLESMVRDLRSTLETNGGAAERLAERLDSIAERLDSLDRLLNEVQAALAEPMVVPAIGSEAAAARLSGLEKRLARLPEIEKQLVQIETQAATQKAATQKAATEKVATEATSRTTARAQGADSFLLAAARLRQALEGEAPFADELAALRRAAGADPAARRLLAPLEAHAETGIADRGTLRRRFEAAAREVENGEAESDVAGREAEEPGLLSRALANLASLVRIRLIDEVTATPEARKTTGRIGDARRALAEGDLDAAVRALESLPEPRAAAFTGWLSEAQARVAAGHNGPALLSLAAERAAVTRDSGTRASGGRSPATAPTPAAAP